MDIKETSHNQSEEAAVPEVVERAPEPAVAGEVEIQPSRRRRKLLAAMLTILSVVICAFAYWKRAALLGLVDIVLPYSSAIAFVSLGVIGVRYKDKYAHPLAARAALTIMIVFGCLMGVNTYREQKAASVEEEKTADSISQLTNTVRANAGKTESSLKALDGDFTDFKDKVKPDELRSEMSDLRSTMDRVINPPKAKLLFSFEPLVNPPLEGRAIVPIRDVTLPLNQDGSVHVRFTTINNTDVVALGAQVSIEICRAYKFAKEPEGFTRIAGSPGTTRDHVYGDMPAAGCFPELSVDVIPPANAGRFDVEATYACKTCVVQHERVIGTVHILRR
jgi:hypothetical protein